MFEHLARGLLAAGGTFTVRELSREDGVRAAIQMVTLPRTTQKQFGTFDDVQPVDGATFWHKPFLPAVDGFISAEFMFQATVARTHSVNAPGLSRVLHVLRQRQTHSFDGTKFGPLTRRGFDHVEKRLFFVVPDAVFDDEAAFIKHPALTRLGDARDLDKATVDVRQFFLRIPLGVIEKFGQRSRGSEPQATAATETTTPRREHAARVQAKRRRGTPRRQLE